MKWISVIFLLFSTFPAAAAMKTRIVDVGPGLCAITEIDKSHYFLYDAGHWQGNRCYDAVSEMVTGNDIDLIVLSHSDSDHLGDAARILNNFSVKNIVRTGMERKTNTWQRTDEAISLEADFGSQVYNFQEYELKPGKLVFSLGDAQVSILYGKGSWTGLSESENRNAISIVARLSYKGHSILFTGDTIGRRINDEASACKDAEAEMVALHLDGHINLDSDVIIAPHHGGNNGSASCFLKAVSPEYVIFPSGHEHGHPAFDTYQRYIHAGVNSKKIFRTDLNDAESDTDSDWEDVGLLNCIDMRGDDDIEIKIDESLLLIAYRDDGVDSLCKQ